MSVLADDRVIPESLKWYVYKPISWQHSVGYRRVFGYCCASVHEEGRSVGFRQCQRTPVVDIEGFGFCKQHARKIQNRENVK